MVANNDYASIDKTYTNSYLQENVKCFNIYNQFIDLNGDASYMIPILIRMLHALQ